MNHVSIYIESQITIKKSSILHYDFYIIYTSIYILFFSTSININHQKSTLIKVINNYSVYYNS